MAKKTGSGGSGGQRRSTKIQHSFHNMREPLVNNTVDKAVYKVLAGSDGAASISLCLCPVGLNSVNLNSTVFTEVIVDTPHLLWFGSQATNFGLYRVTRAKLVFIGNAGSTTSGTLNLFGSSDPADAADINTAFMQGGGSKSYDLASSASRELSLNIPVDSSWKKVSKRLAMVGTVAPWFKTSSTFIPLSTVSDLSFATIQVQVVGAPANQNCGNLFLDYDVEFKDPVSLALNT